MLLLLIVEIVMHREFRPRRLVSTRHGLEPVQQLRPLQPGGAAQWCNPGEGLRQGIAASSRLCRWRGGRQVVLVLYRYEPASFLGFIVVLYAFYEAILLSYLVVNHA